MRRQTENAFRFFVMWTACAAKTAGEKTPSPPQTRQPATENPEHKKRPLLRCVESENLTDNKTLHAAKFSRFSAEELRVC